jgi:hypothetical protein
MILHQYDHHMWMLTARTERIKRLCLTFCWKWKRSCRSKEYYGRMTYVLKLFYDTFTNTAVRTAYCVLLLEGLRLSYAQARWTRVFIWFGPQKRNALYPRVMLYCYMYVALLKTELNSSVQPFTFQCPTDSLIVVESLYSMTLPTRSGKWCPQWYGVCSVLSSCHAALGQQYGAMLSGHMIL